jgi:hypothetical protein
MNLLIKITARVPGTLRRDFFGVILPESLLSHINSSILILMHSSKRSTLKKFMLRTKKTDKRQDHHCQDTVWLTDGISWYSMLLLAVKKLDFIIFIIV